MRNLARYLWLAAILSSLTIATWAAATGKAVQTPLKKTAPKTSVKQHSASRAKRAAHQHQKQKLAAGEASRLERNESGAFEDRSAREDNHGRIVSHHAVKPQVVNTRAKADKRGQQHSARVVSADAKSAGTARRHASVISAQMTPVKEARVHTNAASLHQGSTSAKHRTSAKAKGAAAPPSDTETSNPIHLKKNNARMF